VNQAAFSPVIQRLIYIRWLLEGMPDIPDFFIVIAFVVIFTYRIIKRPGGM
jgi:hypothetical protein